MTRLRRLTRDELTGPQRELYDLFAGGDRIDRRVPFPPVGPDGALEGPFNAMLYSPELGTALQSVGAKLRTSTLSDRCRELAILVVAAGRHSEFEWAAHERIGRAAGLSEEQVAAIESGAEVPCADTTEDLVVRTARALVAAADLDDGEYSAAVAGLGEQGLYDLITLVGYYTQLALQLRVFRVVAPEMDRP